MIFENVQHLEQERYALLQRNHARLAKVKNARMIQVYAKITRYSTKLPGFIA